MLGWMLIKRFAELNLALSVWHLFEHARSVGDVIRIFEAADDVTRLGILTIFFICVGGIVGVLKAVGLPDALRLLLRLFRAMRTWLGDRRRKQRPRRRPDRKGG